MGRIGVRGRRRGGGEMGLEGEKEYRRKWEGEGESGIGGEKRKSGGEGE